MTLPVADHQAAAYRAWHHRSMVPPDGGNSLLGPLLALTPALIPLAAVVGGVALGFAGMATAAFAGAGAFGLALLPVIQQVTPLPAILSGPTGGQPGAHHRPEEHGLDSSSGRLKQPRARRWPLSSPG